MTSINKIARVGIISGLLMGAVAMKATNPITTIDKAPNQTEVVSKEGAAALRAMNVQTVQQASVPNVHNTKLDNTLRKFIESNDDKEFVNGILSNVYKENGTFLGSALLQHEINSQQLFAFMSGNTKVMIENGINPKLGKEIKSFGEKFYTTVTPNSEKVINWVLEVHNSVLMNLLQFDHKPNADEVCKRLDNIAKTKVNFSKNELAKYLSYSNDFMKNKINMRQDTQAMSDLIAYKMFLIDETIFYNKLRDVGVGGEGRFENGNKYIFDYYKEWFKSIEPQGK